MEELASNVKRICPYVLVGIMLYQIYASWLKQENNMNTMNNNNMEK